MDNILKHGGYMTSGTQKRLGMESTPIGQESIDVQTDFDYMFPELADNPEAKLSSENSAQTIEHLKELARALIDNPPETESSDSRIPTIYTYWGQFIDHDVTANTDRNDVTDITKDAFIPLDPTQVTMDLKNLRRPQLDLDSVYGDGPDGDAHLFYDGAKFRLGVIGDNAPGVRIPDVDDNERDLPRIGQLISQGVATEDSFEDSLRNMEAFRRLPWIGDMRNDENTIVAQFHQAVLRFHNKVVDRLEGTVPADKLFAEARKLTTWHYQWLVINDYLKTITYPGIVDEILCGGRKFYDPDNQREFMPLEHSVAAFRFGHTMVRNNYDFNRNFPDATFRLLFLFTGGGGFAGSGDVLPFNWVIEFDRFTNHGSSDSKHFARKIDTLLAEPLTDLANEGNEQGLDIRIKEILKHLAMRNLLRGYLLSMPTGQAIAEAMGVDVLTEDEFRLNNSPEINQILDDSGFINRTPLWYYILKEAEVRADGNCLGEVGSRIISETFIGLIEKDPSSYRNKSWNHNWHPGLGMQLENGGCIVTIKDFISFAGLPV